MKRKITFTLFILVLNFGVKAQVIDVIDAIGSKLLPKITESVKDIISSNVKDKKKAEVETQIVEAISKAKKEIISGLDEEISNIENINNLHALTRQMAIGSGSLKTLANRNLINSLKDVSTVKLEVALLFVKNLNQILDFRQRIDAIKISAKSPELKNNLKGAIESMDQALGRLKTTLQLTGNNLSFSSDKVENYISGLDRSSEDINDLTVSIDATSRLIESYLEAYLDSFKNLKNSISK